MQIEPGLQQELLLEEKTGLGDLPCVTRSVSPQKLAESSQGSLGTGSVFLESSCGSRAASAMAPRCPVAACPLTPASPFPGRTNTALPGCKRREQGWERAAPQGARLWAEQLVRKHCPGQAQGQQVLLPPRGEHRQQDSAQFYCPGLLSCCTLKYGEL